MKAKKPAPGKAPRKAVDWEKAERMWVAGQLTLREIGRQCGVSAPAVLKRSKKWPGRDLSEKIRTRTKSKLLVQGADGQQVIDPKIEQEIIEEAAENAAMVVRMHRRDLTQGQQICGQLFEQLKEAASCRGDIAADIDAEMGPEIDRASGQERQALIARKNRMLRAIELPTHAGTLRDLSSAMKNFQALERVAWNLNAEPEKPDPFGALSDDQLAQKEAALAGELERLNGR